MFACLDFGLEHVAREVLEAGRPPIIELSKGLVGRSVANETARMSQH